MPDIKWIKITTEMFDDEKIRIIEAMPEADTLIVIWIRLICMAGKVNEGGYIFLAPDLPYNEEALAAVFNRPVSTVRLALDTFVKLRMMELHENGHIYLPNFAKYQSIKGLEEIREATRLRVAKHRETHKLLKEVEPVALRNVTSNTEIRKDKKREDKKREEVLTIWENVLSLLKTSVNKQNYETWLEGSIGIEINNDEIIVGVTREQQAKHIENSMLMLVEKCIEEVTVLPLKLRLVLIEK